jgi:hypothetical protein
VKAAGEYFPDVWYDKHEKNIPIIKKINQSAACVAL